MILVDIFGAMLAAPLIDEIGSSELHPLSFFSAGVCLVVCGMSAPGSAAIITYAMFGRLFLAVTFTSNCVLLVELFDPCLRGSAQGTVGFFGRLCTLFAPVAASHEPNVSCRVFGLLCLGVAVVTKMCLIPKPTA